MMRENLAIGLVQANLIWERIDDNLTVLGQMVREHPGMDIYLLPEMFSTGFSMRPQLFAKDNTSISLPWMSSLAREMNALICGSLILPEGEGFVNRFVAVGPEGEQAHYNKKHLFSLGNEQSHYQPGTSHGDFFWRGWAIRPLVCYDLRFPVWARNTTDYDLLLVPANWPARRSYAWKQLLIARAIENMAYVAGVNRVGEDGNGIEHSGCSLVADPLGVPLAGPVWNREEVLTTVLSRPRLQKLRERLGFLNDRDLFDLRGREASS